MTKREGAISILKGIDPNGAYTDDECIAEGLEPMTLEEALELIKFLEGEE
jgi:hypothetical protein